MIIFIIFLFHSKHTVLCLVKVKNSEHFYCVMVLLTSLLHLVTFPRSLRLLQWFPLHS